MVLWKILIFWKLLPDCWKPWLRSFPWWLLLILVFIHSSFFELNDISKNQWNLWNHFITLEITKKWALSAHEYWKIEIIITFMTSLTAIFRIYENSDCLGFISTKIITWDFKLNFHLTVVMGASFFRISFSMFWFFFCGNIPDKCK